MKRAMRDTLTQKHDYLWQVPSACRQTGLIVKKKLLTDEKSNFSLKDRKILIAIRLHTSGVSLWMKTDVRKYK
jgi:hypothetical protein